MVFVMADLASQQVILFEIGSQDGFQGARAELLAEGFPGDRFVVLDKHRIKGIAPILAGLIQTIVISTKRNFLLVRCEALG
jgi:hypothetical protein